MLRVTESKNAEAAKQYFGKSMVRSDYYSEGQEIAGLWGGKAAERLGLVGQVDQESYFALCDNRNPETGESLTPRQKANRRAGYDFTFSAPKSVSVMYELSGDERILTAFRDAVKETMDEIELEMKTRVRKNGRDENRMTGNMVWAEFVHFTSRPVDGKPDPHLHAHVFAHNVTWDDEEGRFKAGQFGDLKRDAPYYEAAFDARLSHMLNALGYGTEREGLSYEIAGVPESVIDKFSRRRNEIEEKAAKRGVTTAEGKHAIGYWGRENKKSGVGKPQLRREWNERLTHGERVAMAEAMGGKPGGSGGAGSAINAQQAMDYAVGHCFERASVTSEKRLKAEALRYGVGQVLPEAIDKAAKGKEIIRRERHGEMLVTTRAVRTEELQMLRFVREGRGQSSPFAKDVKEVGDLKGEQLNAALHVLQSRDRVVGIRGAAGTGKTTMMKATVAAIEESGGGHVLVFAPSAQASRSVLHKDGFKEATTVAQLLVDEKLQQKAKGQVLWIDEAGLMSSKDARKVFQLAEELGSRIVLSGDYKQHSAVARGDAFRLLESEAGLSVATLTQIRRQKKSDYRKAVEAISTGTAKGAEKGFELLDKMGAIVEASGEQRRRMLVNDYMDAVGDGETALVIAPTHAEGMDITMAIREELMQSNKLGGHECFFKARRNTHWTTAQKGDARNYRAGQVVKFHKAVAGVRKGKNGVRGTTGGYSKGESAMVLRQDLGHVIVMRQDGSQASLPLGSAERYGVYETRNLAVAVGERLRITENGHGTVEGRTGDKHRLNNGDIFTVEGFTKKGDIKLENGVVLPKDFGHIAHGYVDTSHASQGKTVDRVFIAVGDESLRAANRAQWYVSVSRGRESVKIYTEDAQALKEAVQKSPERMSVSEMMREKKPRRLDMRRIARYFKERMQDAYDAVTSRGLWQQRVTQQCRKRDRREPRA